MMILSFMSFRNNGKFIKIGSQMMSYSRLMVAVVLFGTLGFSGCYAQVGSVRVSNPNSSSGHSIVQQRVVLYSDNGEYEAITIDLPAVDPEDVRVVRTRENEIQLSAEIFSESQSRLDAFREGIAVSADSTANVLS